MHRRIVVACLQMLLAVLAFGKGMAAEPVCEERPA
jgi:hypothetical protein